MYRRSRLLLATLLIATLGAGFLAGFFAPLGDDFFALRKNFEIFSAVYEELIGGYVDPLDPEKLMRSGIEAMLDDLDPYTTFIDEAENADIEIITRGRYGGVGLNVGMRGGKVTVLSPIEGASGYKQGVRAGDIITQIAGQSTEALSLAEVRGLMRGEPGTAVEISVLREGEPEPLPFLLTREEVKLKNVTYSGFIGEDTLSGIGYIKLERFAREADLEMRRALEQLQETGPLRGVILDLRDNPGGLLDAAVDITELFVPQGSVIVSTRGRLPQTERVYRSKMPPMVPDVPLVVLVNGLSASASEIVAGALQDLDRGIIVGQPTYGKGLVQIIKPLKYNTSLKMTTSRYFMPSGRSIQAIDYSEHDGNFKEIPDSLRRTFRTSNGRPVMDGRGITPDVEVSPGEQSALEEALQRRAAFFFFANHFAAEHPSIEQNFAVTDPVLDAFEAWLGAQQFSYDTEAERAIDELVAALEDHGFDSGAEAEVAALRQAVQQEKAVDFERHEGRLKELLRREIVTRYFGETAQIEATFAHDPQLHRAAELLRDPRAQAAVLQPSR